MRFSHTEFNKEEYKIKINIIFIQLSILSGQNQCSICFNTISTGGWMVPNQNSRICFHHFDIHLEQLLLSIVPDNNLRIYFQHFIFTRSVYIFAFRRQTNLWCINMYTATEIDEKYSLSHSKNLWKHQLTLMLTRMLTHDMCKV